MGQLVGQRRIAWRDLLVLIYEIEQPVSVSLVQKKVPALANRGTAANALTKLNKMGLLQRIGEERSKGISYQLSWPGRGVAVALKNLPGIEEATQPPIINRMWTSKTNDPKLGIKDRRLTQDQLAYNGL